MLESKDLLQIMLSEYSFIKNEFKTYVDLFHKQTNFITIYFPLIVGAIGIGVSLVGKNQCLPSSLLAIYKLPWPYHGCCVFLYQIVGFFIYLLLAMVGFFFAAATLSYIYVIEILARRAEIIERSINKLAECDILVWEIAISPRLIRNMLHKGIWISPSTIRIVWSFGLLIIILVMQIITADQLMGHELSILLKIIIAITMLFYSIQTITYVTIGIPEIIKVVERESIGRNLE